MNKFNFKMTLNLKNKSRPDSKLFIEMFIAFAFFLKSLRVKKLFSFDNKNHCGKL